ncbi:protein FAM204A [Ixodes scapularis]
MNAAVHPALSDDDEELDLSEIDIFVRRPIEPKGSPTRTSSGSSKFLSQTSSAPLYVRPDLRMRFQEASGEASQLRERTAALSRRTEQRRRSRLRKRLAREANAAPEGTTQTESSDWSGVREFLTVNDHLAGPVSHGDCGPKTELESLVDAAIAEGDLDRAEMLSNHLADRQFAVKIANAFAAKRFAEEQKAKKLKEYVKRQRKLPWGFEAKERWQMKGNM